MAELVVACFDTQFGANAAAEKLLSCGLQREQIVLTFSESVGHSPSSSSAPSSVVSAVSHRGDAHSSEKNPKHSYEVRSPSHLPDPSRIGHTTMVVELRGEVSMGDACALLSSAGASSINPTKHHDLVPEDPAMWPMQGHALHEDIERSIAATKRGAGLKSDDTH